MVIRKSSSNLKISTETLNQTNNWINIVKSILLDLELPIIIREVNVNRNFEV